MNNNPLRQYFRRPSVFVKLPSGGNGYPQGAINMTETGELPVYPMTAIDDITSKTPDALYNGSAMAEIIKSCVPDIKDPWAIKNIDLDSILIAIRAASGMDKLELASACPNCNNNANYEINLMSILNTLKAGDYNTELDIGSLKFKFRPLEYRDMNKASLAQLEIQKLFANIEKTEDVNEKNKFSEQALKELTELTMQLVARSIEYIRTPEGFVHEPEFILDFLKNCDKNDYIRIRDHNSELRSQAELKPLDIKCVECNNEYKQPFTLNMSDFFG
jgi:hypothetical protein